MRCKGCDYALWNLTSRQCPECGRPFAPSEFDFVPNAVRFLCPDCGQEYYGTSPRGHLEPEAFQCVRCGRALHMDEMVLTPAEGVPDEQTRPDVMPWLERRRLGFIKAWGGTIWRVLFSPGRLARVIPDDSPVLPAWWFALLTLGIALVIGCTPASFMMIFAMPRGVAVVPVVVSLALAIVVLALIVPAWGLAAHLILRLTGRTALGLGATVRTVCYAAAGAVLVGIPCAGPYFWWVLIWLWPTVAGAIMLSHAQRISGWRAAIAMATPPLLVIAAACLLIVAAVVPQVRMATATVRAAANQFAPVRVYAALAQHAAANQGQYPIHVLRMVHDGELLPSELQPPVPGQPSRPLGLLDQYQVLPSEQQARLVEAAEAAAQAAGGPYRLGDFIFTYPGVDLANADPKLWVLIYDPPASTGGGPAPPLVAVTVMGMPVAVQRTQLAADLAAQNALRAGLPPIPDPSTIQESGLGEASGG